jgi:MFS family permease
MTGGAGAAPVAPGEVSGSDSEQVRDGQPVQVTTVSQPAAPARTPTGALGALCLVQFVDVLGVTVVVTALPSMLAGVHAPPAAGSLVATGYAMFFGGLLMFGARLGDRLGHRRTILLGLAAFAVGALLAAVAPSIAVLTAGRCVQGAAAATAVPSALRLLTSLTESEPARARAVAAWSAAGAAAGASGFVVGGVVTDLAGWRVIFWALLPTAALLALAVVRTVPPDRREGPGRPLNARSSLLLTASVMALVVGTTALAERGHRGLGAALVVVAAALAVALAAADRRASAPLLPPHLLAQPRLRRGAMGSFLNTATTSSAATLVTLYLQDTQGRSPLAAAATLVPFSLAVVLGSALAPAAIRRAGRERVAAAGLALIAAANVTLIAVAAAIPAIGACTALSGFGIGLSSVAATSLGTDVPEADRAAASGIVNTAAQLGTAIGVAALLLVAAASTGVPGADTGAPSVAWAVAAAVAAAGAAGFAVLRGVRPTKSGACPSR